MKLRYQIKLGLFGSTDNLNQIQEEIDKLLKEGFYQDIDYITGSLGYVANALLTYNFEPEREYNHCIIFWDNSEECTRVFNYCKQMKIPCFIINKQLNKGFVERIIVENYYKYQRQSNDYVVYIGRGKCDKADYIANTGNPFIVKQYGRGIALQKYNDWITEDKLVPLANHLKTIKGKRIVLLCWCKPKPCHGDTIKQMLINLGV